MEKETAGIVILLVCCWGCAALFFGIGAFARRYQKPMWFWSGTTIDPKTVTDLDAYNRANARMWELYSIPYWIAGFLAFAGKWGTIAGVILMTLACFPGLLLLIRQYRRIEVRYIKKGQAFC